MRYCVNHWTVAEDSNGEDERIGVGSALEESRAENQRRGHGLKDAPLVVRERGLRLQSTRRPEPRNNVAAQGWREGVKDGIRRSTERAVPAMGDDTQAKQCEIPPTQARAKQHKPTGGLVHLTKATSSRPKKISTAEGNGLS